MELNEPTQQKSHFLRGEGNRYFRRNRAASFSSQHRKALDLIAGCLTAGSRVLEIGCCDGRNLRYLKSRLPIHGSGVDPSEAAVKAGRKAGPSFSLKTGTADRLPYKDRSFDMVIFGFCLYLVDRSLLTRVVAETDRVLRDRGYVAIIDFDVKTPISREYKHKQGVLSHKLDYPALFTAFPHYAMADKYCYSHAGERFSPDIQERLACTILYKDLSMTAPAVGDRHSPPAA